ncbi:MAG: response regulator [Acidobacteriota bacterium]
MPSRILIVDSDQNSLFELRTMLETLGYQTDQAADGIEGFEKAKAEPPALVVTEIMLDRLSGFEMALRISQAGLTCPVLFYTWFYRDQRARQEVTAKYAGKGYFIKPFQLDALKRAIEDLGVPKRFDVESQVFVEQGQTTKEDPSHVEDETPSPASSSKPSPEVKQTSQPASVTVPVRPAAGSGRAVAAARMADAAPISTPAEQHSQKIDAFPSPTAKGAAPTLQDASPALFTGGQLDTGLWSRLRMGFPGSNRLLFGGLAGLLVLMVLGLVLMQYLREEPSSELSTSDSPRTSEVEVGSTLPPQDGRTEAPDAPAAVAPPSDARPSTAMNEGPGISSPTGGQRERGASTDLSTSESSLEAPEPRTGLVVSDVSARQTGSVLRRTRLPALLAEEMEQLGKKPLVVRVVVGRRGEVLDATAVQSSLSSELIEKIVSNVKEWRFSAHRQAGETVTKHLSFRYVSSGK